MTTPDQKPTVSPNASTEQAAAADVLQANTTPNTKAGIRGKLRWIAAVGLGFLALGGGLGIYAASQGENDRLSSDEPDRELNLNANPYKLSPEERMRIAEVREKECGGVFSPDTCWTIPGLNPRLFTQGMVKFTPIIPMPGETEYGMTNDTFTKVPLYKENNQQN